MVNLLLPSGRRLKQVPGARELLCGKGVLRFELGDIGLVEIDLRLKRRLFELVEEVALFDLGALDKFALFEKGGDAGDQRHASDRLDAADEFVRLRDVLASDAHDPDRRRPVRRGLSFRLKRERCEEEGHQEMQNDYLMRHCDSSQMHATCTARRGRWGRTRLG